MRHIEQTGLVDPTTRKVFLHYNFVAWSLKENPDYVLQYSIENQTSWLTIQHKSANNPLCEKTLPAIQNPASLVPQLIRSADREASD